jgi:hypothetical protein
MAAESMYSDNTAINQWMSVCTSALLRHTQLYLVRPEVDHVEGKVQSGRFHRLHLSFDERSSSCMLMSLFQ